jgi:hypothetical protein
LQGGDTRTEDDAWITDERLGHFFVSQLALSIAAA